jgi:hypothetical protein
MYIKNSFDVGNIFIIGKVKKIERERERERER